MVVQNARFVSYYPAFGGIPIHAACQSEEVTGLSPSLNADCRNVHQVVGWSPGYIWCPGTCIWRRNKLKAVVRRVGVGRVGVGNWGEKLGWGTGQTAANVHNYVSFVLHALQQSGRRPWPGPCPNGDSEPSP